MARKDDRLSLGGRKVDLVTGEVVCPSGSSRQLSHRELELLCYLLARANTIVSRRQLLVDLWHREPDAKTRAVDSSFRRLRRKLEPEPENPARLESIYRRGYRLNLEPVDASDTRPSLISPSARHLVDAAVAVQRPRERADGTHLRGRVPGRDAELGTLTKLLQRSVRVQVIGPPGAEISELAEAALGDTVRVPLGGRPPTALLPTLLAALSAESGPDLASSSIEALRTSGHESVWLEDPPAFTEAEHDLLRQIGAQLPHLVLVISGSEPLELADVQKLSLHPFRCRPRYSSCARRSARRRATMSSEHSPFPAPAFFHFCGKAPERPGTSARQGPFRLSSAPVRARPSAHGRGRRTGLRHARATTRRPSDGSTAPRQHREEPRAVLVAPTGGDRHMARPLTTPHGAVSSRIVSTTTARLSDGPPGSPHGQVQVADCSPTVTLTSAVGMAMQRIAPGFKPGAVISAPDSCFCTRSSSSTVRHPVRLVSPRVVPQKPLS